MFIKDSVFREFINTKKWAEIVSIKTLEFWVSIIVSIIVTVIMGRVLNYSSIEDINNILRTLTKDVAIALVGLMGFLITGLAILLSSISSKVMHMIQERGKEKSMNRIFLGFYFEGILIGFLIVILFIAYIASFLNISVNIKLCLFIGFILTYLVVFVLFYSVGLIGNCISIFRIVNNYSSGEIYKANTSSMTDKDRLLYNEIRLMVLEQLLIIQSEQNDKKNIFESYKELMEKNVNLLSIDENQKSRIINYFNSIYK